MRLKHSICVVTVILAACTAAPTPKSAQIVTDTYHPPPHPKPYGAKARARPGPPQPAPTVAVTVTDELTPAQKEDLFNRFDAWQAAHGSE